MNVSEHIRKEVEKRVAAILLPRVLELREQQHKKSGHRHGCDCTYCAMKRRATAEIGHLRYYMHRPDKMYIEHPEAERSIQLARPFGDSRYYAEVIRESLRYRYRTLLHLEEHREMNYGTQEESGTGEAD